MLSSTEEQDRRLSMSLREEESDGRRRRMSSNMSMTHRLSWTTWTWTIVFTCLLLLLSSVSVHSIPLVSRSQSIDPIDLSSSGDSRGGLQVSESDSSPLSSSSSSQIDPLQHHQQLVRQNQLYLPNLMQAVTAQEADTDDNGQHLLRQSPSQSEDEWSASGTGGTEWETVIDPHLYVLNEWMSPTSTGERRGEKGDAGIQQERQRRNAGPSLSIVNPLDVLRQRLLLEIARRRMIKSQNQIMANAEILRKVGRRRR